ncbi:hypothetical protein QO008_000458 [Peptoniphilus ivorii]|uniref:S-layer homology domain-containing protein n=1 Tax=Aedoeadaptatus ivorii TaxID=54006 RepID=UPI0027886193|nr:S-layer homology domain-containing protein [Peptoniphilus ivorii]MDQ0508014.1 hypothetical protein [Peptoniphilus ivorii]
MKQIRRKIAAALAVLMLLPSAVYAKNFSDIGGHWSAPYVRTLSDMGIVSGYGDGSFRPNGTVSKAEFFAMVNRAAGLRRTYTVTFSDVAPGSWYYREVAKGVKAGYLTPTTGRLHPNQPISRQEAMRILAYMYNMTASPGSLSRFSDANFIAPAARPGVAALVDAGVVSGYGDGRFVPGGSITRGEVAKVFQVLIANYNKPPARTILDSKIPFGPRDLYE